MPFDSDPKDEIESYVCQCGGDIVKNDQAEWECNKCGFKPREDEGRY